MTAPDACPHCGSSASALATMNDAVLAIAAELAFEPILERIVHASRELVGARYAAIGIPDGDGGFAQFITSGMTEKQHEALGDLPRTHGVLGLMLENPAPYRTDDIQQHPSFEGWPDVHPSMHAFLGVPIVSKGEIIGAFYLTDKTGERHAGFTDSDQELIESLAAHAAIAIENARLFARSRELSVVEERNRMARELHDSVTQTLVSVLLSAETAARVLDGDPERARRQIATVVELSRAAMAEMRELVFELRPADLDSGGLVETLRKHVDVLSRVHELPIELAVDCPGELRPALEDQLYRIAQEAISNALKHAGPSQLSVDLSTPDGQVVLTVSDDGCGFDSASPRVGQRLGLTSMRERATALGGTLVVESTPGSGTTVRLEVPAG